VQLIKKARKSIVIKNVSIPEFLISIMDSCGYDNCLFIFQNGFARTPDNFSKQYYRRKLLSLKTLGLYETTPKISASVMVGLAINKKTKKISLFKELDWTNRDPMESNVIKAQVRDIVLGYFDGIN
jgi:hypothetical protein